MDSAGSAGSAGPKKMVHFDWLENERSDWAEMRSSKRSFLKYSEMCFAVDLEILRSD
jgi:outer membrane protease